MGRGGYQEKSLKRLFWRSMKEKFRNTALFGLKELRKMNEISAKKVEIKFVIWKTTTLVASQKFVFCFKKKNVVTLPSLPCQEMQG